MILELGYLLYLGISIAMTIWVARTLSRNGEVFLVKCFGQDEQLAKSTNHLLVVGFYLVNIGFIALRMDGWNVGKAEAAMQELETGIARHARLAAARRREFTGKWRVNRALRALVGSPAGVALAARIAAVWDLPIRSLVAVAGDVALAFDEPGVPHHVQRYDRDQSSVRLNHSSLLLRQPLL